MTVLYPQVLVYEQDGLLAHLLRRLGKEGKWFVHEPRRLEACLRLLRRSHPKVVVIKVGHDLGRELTLLERVTALCPDAATVVVGDTHDRALAGLAWDLGAAFVLFPPLGRELLSEVVRHILHSQAGCGPAIEAGHG